MKTTLFLLATILFYQSPVSAEEAQTKEVFITKGVLSIDVMHNGNKIKIQRNQDRDNKIHSLYQRTTQGKVQPMHPFAPHAVETIGELELLDYLQRQANDKSILVVDSRTASWVKRGTIPGSLNIPFTAFKDEDDAIEIMEKHFNVFQGAALNFSEAKTLVMFCNGNWCPQSPIAIRKLLALGYPAAKIKYYRGGMQSWHSLGLTVVTP
jgi:rhodanese-related sulfurtransferase